MTKAAVLIVGAGPTGLMMAYLLARHDIPFRIIDKKAQATQTSNATTLQTRTLEIFKQLGIINDFLQFGHPCESIHFHYKNKEFTQVTFNLLDSVFPYIFALSQADTERILEKNLNKLGFFVERQCELTTIREQQSGYEVQVKLESGLHETLQCDYLLGCDGAHSLVRKHCGLSFAGDELKQTFFIVDTLLDNLLQPGQSHVFTEKGLMLVAFPLGQTNYQISGNLHARDHAKDYTASDIKVIVDERSKGKMSAQQVPWISSFKIHSRLVEKMRVGNIFLLGDAAHIHSPTGGQGMNLGLQDAHNLAWKLALVIKGHALPCLLDSYQQERYPVVRSVIATTKFFTKVLMLANPVILEICKYTAKIMLTFTWIKRFIARRFAQIDTRYKRGIAIHHSGERAGDVLLNSKAYFHDYLDPTRYNVLIFAAGCDVANIYQHAHQMFSTGLSAWMTLKVVRDTSLNENCEHLDDPDSAIHQTYRIHKPTIMVIRPDGYIAYKSCTLNLIHLKQFFMTHLQEAYHVTT